MTILESEAALAAHKWSHRHRADRRLKLSHQIAHIDVFEVGYLRPLLNEWGYH